MKDSLYYLFFTLFLKLICYINYGDNMKVKIFDEDHELDLEDDINKFIEDIEVIEIKYNVAMAICGEDQLYSYSAMIIYNE